MKKITMILFFAAVLLFNSFAAGTIENVTANGKNAAASEISFETGSSAPEKTTSVKTAGARTNTYEGLEITAAVLSRKAILPGSVIPVTVTVANKGNKTVSYAQGSGSFQTPLALRYQFKGLQPVIEKNRLGPSTRDYVTKQLKPGATVSFMINVLAIEPDKQFDNHTRDLYSKERRYIADLEWTELQKRYTGLKAAEPGTYTGAVGLQYSVEEDAISPRAEASAGRIQTKFSIRVDGESSANASDPLAGLTLNEYEGLKVTAAVLPRKAILPGATVPVTVTVANQGLKTVSYVMGSGSYKTPQALLSSFTGLQPVIPKDHLGVVTEDYRVNTLKPGETVSFVVHVLAIEPNAQFDRYTHDLYNGKQQYIAELGWASLKKLHPSLKAAKPGRYTGTVSLRYSIVSGAADTMFDAPTGYAQAKVAIGVTA